MAKAFGETLRSLRESYPMTADELAQAAGLSRQTVHNYETGNRSPTWDAVQKLAAALGVTTDTFREAD